VKRKRINRLAGFEAVGSDVAGEAGIALLVYPWGLERNLPKLRKIPKKIEREALAAVKFPFFVG
jgi:hypothetical protein